jgi:hypothetical protein
MKPSSPILPCLLLLLLFTSCYKVEVERNDLPQGYSVAQLIGVWKVTAVSSDKANDWDGNGTAENDIYSTWPDCKKDNLYQFNSNYTGSYKLDCSDTKAGTWRLDGTVTLVWTPSGSAAAYEKIIYLTSNTFKTEYNLNLPTQTYKITKTWLLQ